jgi:FlaA1/EpsC-like NDP-sugar epimerase
MLDYLIYLPRFFKKSLLILNDIILAIITINLAYFIRLEDIFLLSPEQSLIILISILIYLPMFLLNGFYNNINRYNNIRYLSKLIQLIFIYSVIFFTIVSFIKIDSIPRSITIIQPIIFFLLIFMTRIILIFIVENYKELSNKNNILIFFAKITEIEKSINYVNNYNFLIKGFIDLSSKNLNQKINNINIYNLDKVENLITKFSIKTIFINKNHLSEKEKKGIFLKLNKFNIKIKFFDAILNSEKNELDLNMILKRNIKFNFDQLSKEINQKTILITGAGGSIGTELCNQIVNYKPTKLVILDHSEFNLYKINLHLKSYISEKSLDIDLISVLGSITEKSLVKEIFKRYKPNKVYHSAAYKHVDIVEKNPLISIKNNFFGTLNLMDEAIVNKCSKFVLISTDKAVNPINTMGASKRLSEMAIENYSLKNNKTIFCAVRFGNVLDSSGSVIPLFRKQIKDGGPITLTHPEVKRYFMLVSEAVSLVLSADQMSKGGEIFTLDMGEQYKILDLAKLMIKMNGLDEKNDKNPSGDIEIKLIGLNKEEKLMEELNYRSLKLEKTDNDKIYKTVTKNTNQKEFEILKNKIEKIISENAKSELKNFLKENIEGYKEV